MQNAGAILRRGTFFQDFRGCTVISIPDGLIDTQHRDILTAARKNGGEVKRMYFEYGEAELSYLRKKDKRLGEVIDRVGRVYRTVARIFFLPSFIT